MISNERPWHSYQPQQRQPYRPYYQQPGPPPMRDRVFEQTLLVREIQIERKSIRLTLKENAKGQFVRISEQAQGKMNSIIVPVNGLKDFQKLLAEMTTCANNIPTKEPTVSAGTGPAQANHAPGFTGGIAKFEEHPAQIVDAFVAPKPEPNGPKTDVVLTVAEPPKPTRQMSVEARAKMAVAAKARWAKMKAEGKNSL